MKIEVYHQTDYPHLFHKWTPPAPLVKVDEFELDPKSIDGFDEYQERERGDYVVAEHVYRIHNAVDGTERNVKLRLRSLSVGDVVKLDGRAYAVGMVGFDSINADEMNVQPVRRSEAAEKRYWDAVDRLEETREGE